MALVRRSLGSARLALAAGCLALAAVIAVRQIRDAIATPEKGLDFGPIRDAAMALVHGTSVYSNHRFVYPPTAAVALLPASIGGRGGAIDAWLIACTAGVAVAGMLSMAPWRRGIWPLLAAFAAVLMLKSDLLTDSLWIGNISLLLAPVAVAVLLAFESGRWRAGSALLVASLLIKPLLVPLVLLPLLRGQWRPLLQAAVAGALLLAAAILLVPGGGHFFAVLRFLESGGTLHGQAAVYNVSIRGLAERLGAVAWGSVARALVLVVAVALAYRFARRPLRSGGLAAMGALLMLALLLAGSLSEDHYLLVAAPCVLTALALSAGPRSSGAAHHAGSRLTRLGRAPFALPGLALFAFAGLTLFAFPARYVGNPATSPAGLQVRFVLAELLLAAAAAVLVARSTGDQHAPPMRRPATARHPPG